jgi:hypothetical protein
MSAGITQIGGKGGSATSSSEFLRAYRLGVLAGANASYSKNPRKNYLNTAEDVIDQIEGAGAIAALRTLAVTTNPFAPPPSNAIPPLVYRSNNVWSYPRIVLAGIATLSDNIYANFGFSVFQIFQNGTYSTIRSFFSNIRCIYGAYDGYLYVGDPSGIWKVNPNDPFTAPIRINTGESTIRCISQWTSSEQLVYSAGTSLKIYNGSTISNFLTLPSAPFGVVLVGSYVYASLENGTLIKIDNTSTIILTKTSAPLFTQFVLANDELIYGVTGNKSVYRINPDDLSIITFMTFSDATVSLTGIVQRSDENFYVSATNGRVYQILTDGTPYPSFPPVIPPTVSLVVAGGAGTNKLVSSSDNGVTWTIFPTGNSLFSTGIVYALAKNSTYFIAGGEGTNKLAYSSDGTTWTASTSGNTVFAGGDVYAIAWNGTMWVAGGGSYIGVPGTRLAYSYDGITWYPSTNGTTIFDLAVQGIGWNGAMWVAVGYANTNKIAYSYDGITWYPSTNGNTIFTGVRTVIWTGTMWLAGGNGANRLAYSYDGMTWYPSTSGNSVFLVDLTSLAWNGTVLVAGGNGANRLAYSSDRGTTWTPSASGNSVMTDYVWSLVWTGTYFVAGTLEGANKLAYSSDGITWIASADGNSKFSTGRVIALAYG